MCGLLAFVNNNKEYLFLFVLLAILFAASLDNIERPLTQGHKGYGTGIFLHIGNNYGKDGYDALGAKWNVAWTAETGQETYNYYTHYPAGSFLLYGIAFSLFGHDVVVARLFQILLAGITIILFYYLIKKNANTPLAMLSTAVFLATPLFFFYRDFVQLEFLPLPFALLMLLCYTEWNRLRENKYLYLTCLVAFLGGFFSNWTFYFIGIPIWIHCILYTKAERKKQFLLLFPAMFVLSFAVFLLHNQILTGSMLGHSDNLTGNLFGALQFRMGLDDPNNHYGITLKGILSHLWLQANKYLTPFVLWTAILSIISFALWRTAKNRSFEALMILCLLSATIPAFLFKNLFWIHPHLVILIFTPFAAFLSTYWLATLPTGNNHITYALLLLFSIGFFGQAYDFYKTQEETFVDPLVQFLHDNGENVILTFPLNPQAFQVIYYLDQRKVADARTIADFEKKNTTEYTYAIANRDTAAELREFLKGSYALTPIDEPNQVGAFRIR